MFRVLCCAVLALALLAVALPAVEHAGEQRTASTLRDDAARLERAANALWTDDDAAVGVVGARRRVTIRVPAASPTSAGVERVAVVDGGLRYALVGGDPVRVPVRAPIRTPDGPVVLDGAGRHALTLSLVRADATGALVVVVETAT